MRWCPAELPARGGGAKGRGGVSWGLPCWGGGPQGSLLALMLHCTAAASQSVVHKTLRQLQAAACSAVAAPAQWSAQAGGWAGGRAGRAAAGQVSPGSLPATSSPELAPGKPPRCWCLRGTRPPWRVAGPAWQCPGSSCRGGVGGGAGVPAEPRESRLAKAMVQWVLTGMREPHGCNAAGTGGTGVCTALQRSPLAGQAGAQQLQLPTWRHPCPHWPAAELRRSARQRCARGWCATWLLGTFGAALADRAGLRGSHGSPVHTRGCSSAGVRRQAGTAARRRRNCRACDPRAGPGGGRHGGLHRAAGGHRSGSLTCCTRSCVCCSNDCQSC